MYAGVGRNSSVSNRTDSQKIFLLETGKQLSNNGGWIDGMIGTIKQQAEQNAVLDPGDKPLYFQGR